MSEPQVNIKDVTDLAGALFLNNHLSPEIMADLKNGKTVTFPGPEDEEYHYALSLDERGKLQVRLVPGKFKPEPPFIADKARFKQKLSEAINKAKTKQTIPPTPGSRKPE